MKVKLNTPPMGEIYEGCYYSPDFKHLEKCLNQSIVQLKIDERCRFIDANAFDGCHNLSKIELPANVREIGESAFANCISLREITGTENVEKIGSHAFYHCISLQKFSFPSAVKTVEPYTFYDCRGLMDVGDLSNVKSIGDFAFCNCMTLKTITLPPATTFEYFGKEPFEGCENLDEETKNRIKELIEVTNSQNR